MTLAFRKPMSAAMFNEKYVTLPCYAQPKLDGIRCVTDGRTFWSKNGKEFSWWNTHHLRQRRKFPFLADAEFMVREGGDFEDLASIVKRHKHPDCEDLELNVFDVMLDIPFEKRIAQIKRLFAGLDDDFGWRMVKTTPIRSLADIQAVHRRHLLAGREGTMVRSASGLYVSKRTRDLMKYKPLRDAEFKVDEVIEAKGKDKGTPIFVCIVTEHRSGAKQTFRVRPKGTLKQRRAMWRDRKNIPGKKLTVEFQNLTKYGVPRFPRAKVLRDYE